MKTALSPGHIAGSGLKPLMRIVSLEAHDFRSLQNVRWEPGRLNVLIGPNGSGKTNLVLLLKLMTQSALGKLSETVLRSGGISPLLWDRKSDGFSFLLMTSADEREPGASRPDLSYECEISPKGKDNYYQVQQELLRRVTGQNGKKKPSGDFDFLVRRGPSAQIISKKATWIKLDPESIPSEETLLSECGGPLPQDPTLASFQPLIFQAGRSTTRSRSVQTYEFANRSWPAMPRGLSLVGPT